MKKKVFSLMMTLLLAFVGVAKADVVTIGDGTTTTYVTPYNSLWGYSFVEQIYTADEIGTAGTITAISFNLRESDAAQTNAIDVFMKNVSRTEFSAVEDYEPVTASDMVFSGTVTFNPGWTTITLDTPFQYDGTSNLMIGMHEYTSGYSTRYFYYTSASNKAITFHSDGANPDPYNLEGYTGNKYVSPNRANIQIDITAGGGGTSGEITVHDAGATNSYVPVYGFYADAYLKSEMVYPASELNAMNGGSINSMKFYSSSTSISWGAANFQVFLKEVSGTTISDFSGPGTVVYEGALSIDANGEMMVNFTTPYQYNGGNLLVGVYNTVEGSYVSCTWVGESVSGASVQGYSYSGLSSISATQRDFLPKTTFAYTTSGGGGTGEQIFAVQDGEVVDTVFVGPRPNGAWMEPFKFQIRNTGAATTINVLDWTPDEYFTLVAPELPVEIGHDEDIDVELSTGTSTNTDWQMVAIYGEGRTAAVWNINVEPYDPAIPDVVELAYDFGTVGAGWNYSGIPSQITPTELHNDYTLPFPEIEEGVDAVYKFTVDNDVIISAHVDENAENGKVALYTEDFYGEGGPMATNNYTGLDNGSGGGAAGAPFEVQIGDGTSTSGYMPFYCFYNYSMSQQLFLPAELQEAGVTRAPMTSLSWYCTATNGNLQSNITIWMANVDMTSIGSSSEVTGSMTKVYEGNMTPAVGWNEFVFNQGNFAWDGHSGILVSVQRNNGAWASGINWQVSTQDFTASGYSYNDSDGAYNMATTSYVFGSSGYSYGGTTTNRANIIMKATGRRDNRDLVDFEDGNMPAGWTHYGANDSWYVDNVDYWGYVSAYAGSYSLYIDGNGAYDDDYFVSPALEFAGAGAVSFAYCTKDWSGDQNDLTVAYSTSPTGPWTFTSFVYQSSNAWTTANVDLSALNGTYYIAFISYDGYGYSTAIDNINITGTTSGGGSTPGMAGVSAGPVIENLGLTPGTYYLVASATQADYDVFINVDNMPCPAIDAEGFAFNPQPADNEDDLEPASVTLRWMVPEYATGWRLIFGSTYHPDPSHPQTVIYPEDGSFTTNMANSYTVTNLWNNTNYFWRVEFNNDGCPDGVSSPVWGFTTHLNVPQNLTAVDYTVFNDETVTLNWNAVVDRTYRQYFIYRDGVKIGETNMNQINNTTYTDGPLAYNMNGYVYYVTAVYDEGESAPSNTVTVKVSGRGNVNGHVYEQDGTTGIAGATVTMVGQDEFGDNHTYNFQTNGQGYYSGAVYAGTYNGQAACNGYQTIYEPVQGNPINITYNQETSPVDYILDENFDPVCQVIAEYYPDSLDPQSPYVKVYWGCGLPGSDIIEDFETGDFSMFDWNTSGSYPWEVTTTHPYEGVYCMRSTNYNVASSTSSIDVTVDIPADGIMSFYAYISSESSWDYGYFYIDGVQKGSYTGAGNSWGEKKFDITEGSHNFKWEYTKDGSVNSNEDRFYVDYITFYKQPEPAQPGWHTYCESEFNNAVGSNISDTPSWAYEYPASFLHANYAGWNITKVSLFSDNMYSAVGGNYTCRIYVGGTQPAAGSMVSTITVDVPSNQNAWVDWDLTTPVPVTGNDPIWVVWTANTHTSSWPAGCCGDLNDLGTWWDGGNGWEHLTYGTWTMRHWFTNRAGRSIIVNNISDANTLNSNLRTPVKGEESNAICANENAVKGAALENGNTRRFSHYRVYRTDCYNDGPYTLYDPAAGEFGNTVVLACELHDTIYIDVDWPDVAPGVYKWGVGCVYVGNRGEEYESPITWATLSAKGNRAELTYDFDDNTMQNWTSIDADGDGNGWVSSSNPGIYHNSGVNLSGTGHNSSEAYVISGSYANQTGQVLYPDNYLVSPQIALGGSITFYACAQDASYAAEHFGVAVSTTNNTNASAFTTIQEWTLTAKGASDVRTVGRDGNNRVQGNWYQYTVDLSSYSGMGYVAIRHFNCHDEFILNVDDITIVEGAGGGGGGGATIGLQEPRESEIVWSNCLDKDMYLSNVDVTVLLNSADSPEGTTVKFTNYNEAEQEMYPVDPITLDETGFYAFESFRRGDYKVKVELEGYEPVEDSVHIWDETHLRYVLIEILYGVENVYVSRTGWAMWDDSHNNPGGGGGGGGQGGSGDTFEFGFENGLEGWTNIDANGDGEVWYNSIESEDYHCVLEGTPHGGSHMVNSESYCNCTGALYPDNYLVSPQKYHIANGSTFTLWASGQDASYAAEHFGVAVSTNSNTNAADFTMLQEWTLTAKDAPTAKEEIRGNRAQGTWYQKTVDLSAYAGQDVYIAIRHFNVTDQFILCIDDIALTNGAKNADEMEHFEYYKVMCTSIDGVPIYNHNTVHPFCQLSTNEPYNAPLVEGEHYLCKVATVYSTGMSAWSEPVEWEYEPCDHWGPVDEVTVNTTSQGNHIEWVFEHGFNPYDPGTGGGGGAGDTFTEGFEGGLNGWTVLTVNADGGEWIHSSQNLGGYDYTTLAHTGSGFAMCYSYVDYVGAYNTDSYLITPQKYNIVNGSTLTFFADNANDSYPENFSVCVATADNPSASDFTQVWSGGAKGNGGQKAASHHDANRYQNWRAHSIDLSAYAGQNVYIAFHDVNYDMYEIWIDDVELTTGAKGFSGIETGMMGSDAYALNITDFASFDERVFVAYNLMNDSRLDVVSEGNGLFIISLDNAYEGVALKEVITDFLNETSSRFAAMEKEQAAETTLAYKSSMSIELVNALMMDVYTKSRENNLCELADPFCTDNGMYEFPAGVNAGSGEAGPDYDCLYTTPNPAWYYMQIGDPGAIDIYMYSTPAVDIDFCCWGPFDDPHSACPNGLTEDKVVSCSYSANPTEHCMIPATAQTGEYYILVITNYSNQACNINFSAVAGSGTTNCGILPPVDIIGFLITQDGEYLAFADPTDREYTDIDEFGDHEYCVRPIYPGEMVLPSNNFGWSMGCPVCAENGGGQITCEPGWPIHGDMQNGQVRVWWGTEPAAPIEDWLYYDDGENVDAIGLQNGGTFYWGIKFPASSLAPYEGCAVTKVAYFDYAAHSGVVKVYQGSNGNGPSSNMIGSYNYTANGTEDWVEWSITPASFDNTQDLWIVMSNTGGGQYVASMGNFTGDDNGTMISTDGSTWYTLYDATGGAYPGTWNLRCFVSNQAKGNGQVVEMPLPKINGGELSHSGIAKGGNFRMTRDAAPIQYNVYRSTDNATYEQIGSVAYVDGQTYYEYIDTPATAGNYYYQVTAEYEGCESDPAPAFDNPNVDYVMVGYDAIGENDGMAIFPNPTKGNVTIQAAGMQHVTVVSVLGQVVYDADVDADELILNMSKYTAGMYTIRVTTENGVRVERITVIR